MTCDEAFDLMTNVHRRQEPGLSEHLARCARCRDMHETLAPAIGLLTGSPLGTAFEKSEPVVSTSTQTAIAAGRRLSARSQRESRTTAMARQVRTCLAATAAMAVITFGALAINLTEWRQHAPSTATKCLWQSRDEPGGDQHLTAAMLTAACASCHTVATSR